IWPSDDKQNVTVLPLKIYRQAIHAMPEKSADLNHKYDYVAWAEANPQLVYTPEFYQVSGGAPPPDLNAIYTPANGATNGAAGAGDNSAPDNATQPAAPGA